MRRVKLQRRDGVALITMSALARGGQRAGFDADLRGGLANALELALTEPGLRAVILRADPAAGGWPFDPDPLRDFETLAAPGDKAAGLAPGLATICDRLATAGRPVVALLSGVVSGGGLALAQAAGLRLAQEETLFVSREFALAQMPAAGALVRLAQRAGAGAALDFILGERRLGAAAALEAGLCDAVVGAGTIETAAMTAALAIASGQPPGLPDRAAALAQMGPYFSQISEARQRVAPGRRLAAAERVIGVVEAAALLPLSEALAFETVAHQDLAAQPLAQGLAHSEAARRQARALPGDDPAPERPPEPAPEPAPETEPLGLWAMGDRLALDLALAGHRVVFGTPEAALAPAEDRIMQEIGARVAAGRLPEAEAEALAARLSFAPAPDALARALPEGALVYAQPVAPAAADLAALRAALAGRGALLVVSGAPAGPGEVALLRAARLRELAPEPGVSPADLARAAAPLRRAGATVLRGHGVALRLEGAYFDAAERCVMAGAMPDAVDRALEKFGFALGPFRRFDERGLVGAFARIAAAGRAPGAFLTYLQLSGQGGRGAGQGVYAHAPGQPPALPADTAELLEALRAEAGIAPRPMPAPEIVARVLAELAGEGAALLQAGGALRAGDVDLAAEVVLGFPAAEGGPLYRADRQGALALRKRLRALADEGAPPPVALWDELVREGRGFGL
ncbi:MAG: enoyl-CoA hydratase-related protein [Paracoccaceae bacterium]